MCASRVSSRSAEDRAVLALPDYLDLLGLGHHAPLPGIPDCELCGARDAPVLRDSVRVTESIWAALATRCCVRCGLLFQSPRFAADFYATYYARAYRLLLGGGARPSDAYVADQRARGAALQSNLADYIAAPGRLLDIGCGSGGMMLAFRDRGWRVQGIDPDMAAAAYARDTLGLDVVCADAEQLDVAPGACDLIVITGSLEHVHDPRTVLDRCHAVGAPGSWLLLEAHGLGQAGHSGAIGHNHRRLLTAHTLALLMLRHGWIPEYITDAPLSGPTRPGSCFALGRHVPVPARGAMASAIAAGVRDTPEAMAALLDRAGIA